MLCRGLDRAPGSAELKDEQQLLLKMPADGLRSMLSGQMGCRLHYWPDNQAVWRLLFLENMCMLPSGLPCLLLLCCPPEKYLAAFLEATAAAFVSATCVKGLCSA